MTTDTAYTVELIQKGLTLFDQAVHLECEAFETWGGWVISLAGEWRFALGTTNALTDTIFLPTTTDIARKGDGKIGGQSVERIHPTRRRPFVGVAQYERSMEIPGWVRG